MSRDGSRKSSVTSTSDGSVGPLSEASSNDSFADYEVSRETQAELAQLNARKQEILGRAESNRDIKPEFQRRILERGHRQFVSRMGLSNIYGSRAPLVNNLAIDPFSGFGEKEFTRGYFDALRSFASANRVVEEADAQLSTYENNKSRLASVDQEIQKLTQELAQSSGASRVRKARNTGIEEKIAVIPTEVKNLSVQQLKEAIAKEEQRKEVARKENEELRAKEQKGGVSKIAAAFSRVAAGVKETASDVRLSDLEKALEPENLEALKSYVRVRESLENAQKRKVDLEGKVRTFDQEGIESRKAKAQTRADEITKRHKFDQVDKDMARAIERNPGLEDRLERSWKDKVALANTEEKIARVEQGIEVARERAQESERERREAFKKAEDVKRHEESKEEGFVSVGSGGVTTEDQDYEKKLEIKRTARDKAVSQYVAKTGSTTKWTFEKLEKEVLEDNPERNSVFRPKNINEKREAYSTYVNTLKSNGIILTKKQTEFHSHYEIDKAAANARAVAKVNHNALVNSLTNSASTSTTVSASATPRGITGVTATKAR
jgi:predicted nucleotidyltransferase